MLGKVVQRKEDALQRGDAVTGRPVAAAAASSPLAARPPQRSCEVLFVLDRSGSMEEHVDAAVEGFAGFLAAQRAVASPDAQLLLGLFSDALEHPGPARPIRDVPPLDRAWFAGGGSTALLDALGGTIAEGMTRHAAEGQRPRRTLVVLLTDGEENASREYRLPTVRAMVERARAQFGWEFLLLGVGVDADRLGRDLGILPHLALPVAAGAEGVRRAFAAASEMTQAALEGREIRLLSGK